MAATLSTVSPLGIGYETGYFSGPVGEALAQPFFNAAFAGRINPNPIYKESYHCNIVDECGISEWMDQYMGYETTCYPSYTNLETYGEYNLIKIGATVTVPVYPGNVNVHLNNNSHFANAQFILPQPGNFIITPGGNFIKVNSINLASSGDSIINVSLADRTGNTPAQVLTINDELMVLSGSELFDCQCPTGQFRVHDLPIEVPLTMIDWADKGSICGDALQKCQWLKIPFTDECGNVIEHWYTEALRDMYRDHEKTKRWQKLFHPQWGLIPGLRARGIKWTQATPGTITVADVRSWKAQLNINGISCMEYAIFAGRDLFSQWQQMLLTAGVQKLDTTMFDPTLGCKWINMNYCGIKVEGLTLHIYDECTFSNGKMLGTGSSIFPGSAIIVPMCNRPDCRRSVEGFGGEGSDTRMATTVYFKDNQGKVWDNLTDANGILGPRNTFGVGCKQQDWSIESRFLMEYHCLNQWGFMGL